jgi:hypothetical protein
MPLFQSGWHSGRLVALYMGPFGLLLYVLAAKEPRQGEHETFIDVPARIHQRDLSTFLLGVRSSCHECPPSSP